MFEVTHDRCCGLDVHKKTVVACRLIGQERKLRTFATTMEGITALKAWLEEGGCTHVAMESTGVYWKPIYNLLEGTGMTVILANPQRIKAIPGRKTDVKDAEWIAGLLSRDMIPASFVQDKDGREYRELVRYRRSLVEERTSVKNRIHKTLEGANLKLGLVVSDIQGKTGQALLAAIIAGETDADTLTTIAGTRLKATPTEIRAALDSVIGEHQRMLLASQQRHIDFLNAEIAGLDAEITERSRPFALQIDHLDAITGVGKVTAQEIIAEIGTDMSRFPTAGHLASWAKVCPGTYESAGKRSSATTGKGNRYVRTALVEAAHAAGRSRDTYLSAKYHRLARRIGAKKAALAVGHTILEIAYHILREGTCFDDLGEDYYATRNRERIKRRAVQQLQQAGYDVIVRDAA